jgi:hypothetical protein
MHLEPQVTFKNVAPSDAVLGQIQAHLDKLDRKFGGIRSCRLVFERPKHHLRPEDRFRIDLVLALAGGLEIAINRDAPPVPLEAPPSRMHSKWPSNGWWRPWLVPPSGPRCAVR